MTNEFCFELPGPPKKIVDAGAEDCPLHPRTRCPGRLMNHAEKGANLKPKDIKLRLLDPQQRVLVFVARRQIEPFEELLFNYGDYKKCRAKFGRT